MIHKIHTALHNNFKRQIFAVVANLIDWNSAFVRQCPKMGVRSFQKNGVRNALIPLLVSYFQDRYQSMKWRGINSSPQRINGGGPQGATLGLLEYMSQTNNNADCVGQDERYKFVDDLTTLEIVNLLINGLCSANIKCQVPNDLTEDNQFIHTKDLQSQKYLDDINNWKKVHKIKLNSKKTKTMVFNFANIYQFRTRLKIDNETLTTVSKFFFLLRTLKLID